MSEIKEYDQETYYDLSEFKEANDLFETFLNKCTIVKHQKVEQGGFSPSTMTITTIFCDEINVKMVFQRLVIDKDIVYIEESKDSVRGIKNKKKSTYKKKNKMKKKSNDKRKLGKGSPFSNQISIGFSCNECGHNHKNPICVKIFKNGRVQMTGCKNIEEIERVYTKLYNKINSIKTEYNFNGQKIIISPVKNIKIFKDVVIKTEMINGTFKVNYKIDLNKLYSKLKEVYGDDDIYMNHEKKSPLICYLKKFEIFDAKKSKNKCPSVFVYNSGSINIIATSLDLLMTSYEFISVFCDKYFEDLDETELIYDETFFTHSD